MLFHSSPALRRPFRRIIDSVTDALRGARPPRGPVRMSPRVRRYVEKNGDAWVAEQAKADAAGKGARPLPLLTSFLYTCLRAYYSPHAAYIAKQPFTSSASVSTGPSPSPSPPSPDSASLRLARPTLHPLATTPVPLPDPLLSRALPRIGPAAPLPLGHPLASNSTRLRPERQQQQHQQQKSKEKKKAGLVAATPKGVVRKAATKGFKGLAKQSLVDVQSGRKEEGKTRKGNGKVGALKAKARAVMKPAIAVPAISRRATVSSSTSTSAYITSSLQVGINPRLVGAGFPPPAPRPVLARVVQPRRRTQEQKTQAIAEEVMRLWPAGSSAHTVQLATETPACKPAAAGLGQLPSISPPVNLLNRAPSSSLFTTALAASAVPAVRFEGALAPRLVEMSKQARVAKVDPLIRLGQGDLAVPARSVLSGNIKSQGLSVVRGGAPVLSKVARAGLETKVDLPAVAPIVKNAPVLTSASSYRTASFVQPDPRPAFARTFHISPFALFDHEQKSGLYPSIVSRSFASRMAWLTTIRFAQDLHASRYPHLHRPLLNTSLSLQSRDARRYALEKKRSLEDRSLLDMRKKREELILLSTLRSLNTLRLDICRWRATLTSGEESQASLIDRWQILQRELREGWGRFALSPTETERLVDRSPSSLADLLAPDGRVHLFADKGLTRSYPISVEQYTRSYRLREATRGGIEGLRCGVRRKVEEVEAALWEASRSSEQVGPAARAARA
ncbi:hypothetical protein JCM11641_006149 [Rhodosporidiobolus odoratus]